MILAQDSTGYTANLIIHIHFPRFKCGHHIFAFKSKDHYVLCGPTQ